MSKAHLPSSPLTSGKGKGHSSLAEIENALLAVVLDGDDLGRGVADLLHGVGDAFGLRRLSCIEAEQLRDGGEVALRHGVLEGGDRRVGRVEQRGLITDV